MFRNGNCCQINFIFICKSAMPRVLYSTYLRNCTTSILNAIALLIKQDVMKRASILLMSILVSITIFSQEEADSFLQEFLVGNYSVIGKMVESDDTYYGTMKVDFNNKKFEIMRSIDGKSIKANGEIKKTGPEQIEILCLE